MSPTKASKEMTMIDPTTMVTPVFQDSGSRRKYIMNYPHETTMLTA